MVNLQKPSIYSKQEKEPFQIKIQKKYLYLALSRKRNTFCPLIVLFFELTLFKVNQFTLTFHHI